MELVGQGWVQRVGKQAVGAGRLGTQELEEHDIGSSELKSKAKCMKPSA